MNGSMLWVFLVGALVAYFLSKLFLQYVRTRVAVSALDRQNKSRMSVDRREFYAKVAGVSHRNANGTDRQEIIKKCRPGDKLLFVREPENPYDHDAVMVWRTSGEQIGYLTSGPERVASEISSVMESGEMVSAEISNLTGGTKGKPTRGVNIRILIG